MYPVITFLRHKGIRAVIAVSNVIYKATNGKKPKYLFSATANPVKNDTGVKIVERDNTSVTLAKYNKDGTICNDFKVMTATDFHLDPGGETLNNKTIGKFIDAINTLKPDLVILTGDVIESDCQQIDAVQFSLMMEKTGVHWAYAFGNHETREEKGFFKYLMYKGLSYCPHCLNTFGDSSLFGYGNFAINIKKDEKALLKSLFIFDSGRDTQEAVMKEFNLPEELNGYDFIKPTQIQWYLNEVKRNEKRYGETKSICYMHIPVPEYAEVFDGNEQDGFTPSGKAEILYGTQFEGVGSARYNSGLFEAGIKDGNLQAMFSGHDHVNDFCAIYKGVYLVYTQCGGYNTYSMIDKQGWDEKDCHFGVTLTTLNADGSIKVEGKKYAEFLN